MFEIAKDFVDELSTFLEIPSINFTFEDITENYKIDTNIVVANRVLDWNTRKKITFIKHCLAEWMSQYVSSKIVKDSTVVFKDVYKIVCYNYPNTPYSAALSIMQLLIN